MTEENIFVYKLFLFGRRFNNSANYESTIVQTIVQSMNANLGWQKLADLEHLLGWSS